MDSSDSMFLIEIIVEKLKSHIKCKEFYITSQFANVFTLNLKDPNELQTLFPKKTKRKKKNSRKKQKQISKQVSKENIKAGQSVLFGSNLKALSTNINKYPIQLSLWDKDNLNNRLGFACIAWDPIFIQYLDNILVKPDLQPPCTTNDYNVFDEFTSKRMATIKLNIKLTCLKDKIISSFRSLSEDKPDTFMYTGFQSKASSILSTLRDAPVNLKDETGIIKTLYKDKRHRIKHLRAKNKTAVVLKNTTIQNSKSGGNENDYKLKDEKVVSNKNLVNVKSSILSLVKSDTDLDRNRQIEIVKSKSCSSLYQKQRNILNYIFGNINGPFGSQVYCVGYFTVHSNKSSPNVSPKSSGKFSQKSSGKASDQTGESKSVKVTICGSECHGKKDATCIQSTCMIDMPEELVDKLEVVRCRQVDCAHKVYNEPPPPPDDRVLLDLTNLNNIHCPDMTQKIEEITGGMTANMTISKDSCFCTCECTFGFVKKTTYCEICGGFERAGDDFKSSPPNTPFPCPIFHNLVDKSKKKDESVDNKRKKQVSKVIEKDGESEKDKKGKKKNDRFKFNYGYTAPQIGHSKCCAPCTGALGNVPKTMGWLWTAEDVPGMKFRPSWRPGATNKHVVRMLKMAKNPGQVIKKRRKDTGKKKRPLKRPLLTVHKKDGEFMITMETMKAYAKPRTLNQHPYEDKPVLTYTIGRTDEENRERKKKKERAHRRLERAQREFIQSAFKDMCKEICLKTYQQALGLLPDAEDPACSCYPAQPTAEQTNLDVSCSCSEDEASLASDTDSDEWLIEFTPPVALFDPTYKGKKTAKTDNGSQYSYLDYRVKLLDRYGNQVPRFFKGLDGRTLCSDLGGFWGPDHKWIEINVDGYIAPDGRWAPMAFIGPNGEQVDCDTGRFQSANGTWLVVGVDGYIDCHGRWKKYARPRTPRSQSPQKRPAGKKMGAGDKKDNKKVAYKPSEATWSCFGDANPVELSKLGIVGHGTDKKLLVSTLKQMRAYGEDVRIPVPSTVPRLSPEKRARAKRRMMRPDVYNSRTYFLDRTTCKHPTPSEKGILAVDDRGNKTYFKLKDHRNRRPKQRIARLAKQGISLSSFHVPCLHSFINSEVLRQQLQERRVLFKNAGTQVRV